MTFEPGPEQPIKSQVHQTTSDLCWSADVLLEEGRQEGAWKPRQFEHSTKIESEGPDKSGVEKARETDFKSSVRHSSADK